MSSPDSPVGAKVFQLISCIPATDDAEILAFLASPLSGAGAAAGKKLAEVYITARKELGKAHKDDYGTGDENIRRAVRKKLFAGKPEKSFDTSYRRLLSDLMDVLEKYLIWQEMNRASNLRDLVLARSLSHLQMPESLTTFMYRQMFSHLDDLPSDADSLWYKHRLREKYLAELINSRARQYLPEPGEIAGYFSRYALLKGLKMYCILRSVILSYGKGEVPPVVGMLKEYASAHPDELDELGKLYLMGADLQDAQDVSPENLRAFLAALHEAGTSVSVAELESFFGLAINCASLARFRNAKLAHLPVEVYHSMFSHREVSVRALQQPVHVANYIRLSLQEEGKRKDVMNISISSVTENLPPALRESYRAYLLALIDYYSGNFQKAFDNLGEVSTSARDPYVKLSSLKYKVRILFDAQDVLLTEAHLAKKPGPRSRVTDSRYVSVDTLLERYRKASDYGGGLSAEVMRVHQLFYRHLRELNHCLYGADSPDLRRMKTLKESLTPLSASEDHHWMLGILSKHLTR